MGQVVQQGAGGKNALATANQAEIAQYLTFLLSREMYAVGILNVKEIIEYGQLTEIPMMPAFIRGVINLRGAVVPVVDLSARFGGQQTEASRRTCIVIILNIQRVLSVDEIAQLATMKDRTPEDVAES